jgi:hypothetical protein
MFYNFAHDFLLNKKCIYYKKNTKEIYLLFIFLVEGEKRINRPSRYSNIGCLNAGNTFKTEN